MEHLEKVGRDAQLFLATMSRTVFIHESTLISLFNTSTTSLPVLSHKACWEIEEKKEVLQSLIFCWKNEEEIHQDQHWLIWGRNFFIITKYALFEPQFSSFSRFLKSNDMESQRTQIMRWIRAYTVREILAKTFPDDTLTDIIQHYVQMHRLIGKPSLIRLIYGKFLEEKEQNRNESKMRELVEHYSSEEFQSLRREAKKCGLKTSEKGLNLQELKRRISSHLNGELLPNYFYNANKESTVNFNNGITEKQWMKLQQDGYCVFKNVIAKKHLQFLIDSIKLDSTLLGVTEDSTHAWKILDSVTGLNSSYGWNKRTWAREAAIFPAEHPQVYRILVSSFARFNPTWKEPYKVGIQLYECKEKFPSNKVTSFAHVDAQPFNLLRKLDAAEAEGTDKQRAVPNFIQSWLPLQSVQGAVKVCFGIGCHNTWEEDYRSIPKEQWPTTGDKALNVLQQIPTLQNRMKDITDEIEPGDLVVWHSLIPHEFTQSKQGCRRDTYVNYAWFDNDVFLGHNSMASTLASYINNNSPAKYAHAFTGNSIPSKWSTLHPLIQHTPPPLHILGEALLGLENRLWSDVSVQKILSILFGQDVSKRQELEELLIETVAPIMQKNVECMMELVKNSNYLQKRKRLAEIVGMNLGIQDKVIKI